MTFTPEEKKLIDRLSQIDNLNIEFQKKITESSNLVRQFRSSVESYDDKIRSLQKLEKEVNTLIKEKNKSFPWLSKAIADLLALKDNNVASYLRNKKHPARSAADKVKALSKEKKILVEQLQLAKYTVELYESLFPFLTEFRDDNIEDSLLEILESHHQEKETNEGEDPVKIYLSSGEYQNLTTSDRNQKALDRYMARNRKKSSFQIGKDYERYIGYIYESQGYEVTYFGIEEGKEDLGRDLICKKRNKIEIVQCKYWNSHKTIHEKHINQLFGTTVKYYIDSLSSREEKRDSLTFTDLLKKGNISASFYTSAKLSDTARQFAQALGISVYENFTLKPYPVIKCHINKQSGEKIYHLPFDQMYDRTKLEKKHDEFYAMTVKEAEEKGFRRAWKWRG